MTATSIRAGIPCLIAAIAAMVPGAVSAQEPARENISVYGEVPPEAAVTTGAGPEIEGVISARSTSGNRLQITTADGSRTTVTVTESTRIRARKGLFGINRSTLAADALLNGLPVTVRTLNSNAGLVASQIDFRNTDLKTASMIRNGTAQRFDEQAAATEALRGRMGDIDKYNIKSTTNVLFDTGKWVLSPQAKAELCATASAAEGMDNALLLVVGYTDSRGSEDYNQQLSERRAGRVINHLQQVCGWKPYRMLTPTGMSEADPVASNDTAQGMAQNRRVSVNVLVSKGLDGL